MANIVDDAPRRALLRNLRAIADVLVVVALCNLAAVIVFGGYSLMIAGARLAAGNVDGPLSILAGALIVRLLVAPPGAPLRLLKRFLPWGAAGAAAALCAYLVALARLTTAVNPVRSVVVAMVATLCYTCAWLAYAQEYAAVVRFVVIAAFVLGASALAGSRAQTAAGQGDVTTQASAYAAGEYTPADRDGLLLGGGRGVRIVKCDVGHDVRDSMIIAGSGAASTEVTVESGAKIVFAVAVRKGKSPSKISVSCGPARAMTTLWEANSADISTTSWREVEAPLTPAGRTRVVFSVTGAADADSACIANPRVEQAPPAARRTNVIIFLVDVFRADHLGTYGYSRATSKEIDDLAASGVVFENCFAQAPWTLPSVASLFTSLYPTAHGVQEHMTPDPGGAGFHRFQSALSDDLPTLARTLRRGGYYVGVIQANPLVGPETGYAQGVNEYDHIGYAGWKGRRKEDGSRCDILVDHAIEWLKRRPSGPFFLYLHTIDCHQPLTIVPDMERFGVDEMSRYDATIAYTSVQFARFFEFLKSQGLLENTVVILTGDHGQQFREHGREGHAMDCHVEELHVPLVFWAPGAAHARVKSRVRLVDVAPTLLEAAGLEPMPSAEGESLAGALKGREIGDRDAWSELIKRDSHGGTEHLISLVSGRYRFIYTTTGERPNDCYDIFDVVSDPREYINLASTHPVLVESFKADVSEYIRRETNVHAKLVPRGPTVLMTRERLEKLKALGYISPDTPLDGAGAPSDAGPK